jgi:Family of unknown function (DUF5681)
MSKPIDQGGQPPANDNDNDDYVVGNCRPPIATRFQPGRGGNLKGRPKGSKNFRTLLNEELAEMVVVNENGRRKRMPKRRAFAKKLVNGALGNNPKASGILIDEIRRNEGSGEAAVVIAFDGREDKIVMGSIVRRIRLAEALPADADKVEDRQEQA